MPYRIYVPADYTREKTYPLILFLHGAGERGNDNVSQLKHAVKQMFARRSSPVYQCIVVAPQCPANEKWVNVTQWTDGFYSTDEIEESDNLKMVLGILEEIKRKYSIDCDRVYTTGLSMGGYGSWDLITRHSELFAAAIPVCGGCDVSKAERLKNFPIHTFHGLQDPTVPPNATEAMVNALQDLGSRKIIYTPYPEGGHAIWEEAFATKGLFEWLVYQRISSRKYAEIPPHTYELPKWFLPACIAATAATIATVATVGIVLCAKRKKN